MSNHLQSWQQEQQALSRMPAISTNVNHQWNLRAHLGRSLNQSSEMTESTKGLLAAQYPRKSKEAMMAHLSSVSLAQSQQKKIEGLLQKARDRYSFTNKSRERERDNDDALVESRDKVHPVEGEEKLWQEMQERALATLTKVIKADRKSKGNQLQNGRPSNVSGVSYEGLQIDHKKMQLHRHFQTEKSGQLSLKTPNYDQYRIPASNGSSTERSKEYLNHEMVDRVSNLGLVSPHRKNQSTLTKTTHNSANSVAKTNSQIVNMSVPSSMSPHKSMQGPFHEKREVNGTFQNRHKLERYKIPFSTKRKLEVERGNYQTVQQEIARHKEKLQSPKDSLALEQQDNLMTRVVDQEPEIKRTIDQGFSEYSILSKSLDNPSIITAMRKKFASVVNQLDSSQQHQGPETDRHTIEPIKKSEIATMINKKEKLKKLHLRQSLKPIEKHLSKTVVERQNMAKKRVYQKAKNLPKVKMLKTGQTGNFSMVSSHYDSVTKLEKSLDHTGSRTMLSGNATKEPENFYNNQSTAQLINVVSSVSFAPLNNDSSTQNLEARKIDRINSLKSFVELEQRSKVSKMNIEEHDNQFESSAYLGASHLQKSQKHLNVASSKSIHMTRSQMSDARSLHSLSPQAREEIDRDMRISESQAKIVFRDFSVPVHHGKGKVQKYRSVYQTNPVSRVHSTLGENVDIITNTVQTTLQKAVDEGLTKQEKIAKLQKEIGQGKVDMRSRKSIEQDQIWHMTTSVRNKYFADQFFEKQAQKSNNRLQPTQTIDQALKVPNFVRTGSFEGVALKARNF